MARWPAGPATAQAAVQADDPTVFHRSESTTLRWHLQAGINAVAERNLFWNLAETTAPDSGYEADKAWLELYVKPGISVERTLARGATFYGKRSAVASYTSGTDAFDDGNTGATTLEEAHAGLRGATGGGLTCDLSLGPRELRPGTGMLIASGASSGFERGALKFGPRKAWDRAVIARVGSAGVSGAAFYLSPDELPSSDGKNELAGLDLRHDDERGGYLGTTLLRVLDSATPCAQAAPNGAGVPTVLPGARDGTRALSLYARSDPLPALPNWTLAADFAYEWNDRIDLEAWAGRVQAGYGLPNLPWSPMLSYGYQTFAGDDPGTSKLERFDPLYYEGNPSAWHDLFLEYNRVLNRHTFLSAGVAISVPGKGIRDVTGGDAPNWTGSYVNLVVNYWHPDARHRP